MVRSTRSARSAGRRPTTRSMTGLATRSVRPGLVTRSMSSRTGTTRRRKTRSDPATAIQLCGGRYRQRKRQSSRTVVNTASELDERSRISKPQAKVVTARHDTRVRRKAGNFKVRGKSTNTKRRAASQRSSTPAARPTLGKRLESMVRENKELTRLVNEYKTTASQHLLRNLEENFACPLCFEIICGDWHDMVQCPMCRCPFSTPDHQPRSEYTFPFMPNRALDSAILGQLKSLADSLDVKSSPPVPNALAAWGEGGHSKQDWIKRDRVGRNEMTSLGKQWATMKAVDFVNFKNRLDV
ncbi:hypothetical protein M404DRAFT_896471 [Pisolithus tinctorius Marx 270]|uniref:Uncharacterized protein n=1 Tax=Pisolithus tinctorius Marx 270 TaxID=870435 RepID=A0A0C3IKB1_PISTI|nr:hypothetical protein M404DRAFT_896471 [Pisolithus tinctorius Marx 270]